MLVKIKRTDKIEFNVINFLRNSAAFTIENTCVIIIPIKYKPRKPNGTVHHQFQLGANDIIPLSNAPKKNVVVINPLFLFRKPTIVPIKTITDIMPVIKFIIL